MAFAASKKPRARDRLGRARRRLLRRGALTLGLGATLLAALIVPWRQLRAAVAGSGLDLRIPPDLRVAPALDPELGAHTRLLERKIYKVGSRVYTAVGWGLANIIMIEGRDGLIVVDTGESLEQARLVLAELRKISRKRVAAVILTHHHADHVLGTSVFADPAEALPGPLPIFGHVSLVAEFADENGLNAEIQSIRSAHMYGGLLNAADRAGSNAGIGPFQQLGASGFVPPNRTFADRLETTIAGVRLELRYVPSEADSEIAVFLPDDRILLSAEVVQDHSFPNLCTIRGARFRDPVRWVQSLDLLRLFPADAMVPQHGPPVIGRSEVARVLMLYRDQIQFVHDQTVRFMNKGMTPDELAERIKLPPQLDGEKPWARQYYGTVRNAVRGIYNGYEGWFQGDPVVFDQTPHAESARRLTALMGGRDRVLAAARRAFDAGDSAFAAELTTLLIRIDVADWDARHLKAAAFRKLGYAQMNAPYRNYYLVAAMELDDQLPAPLYLHQAAKLLGAALKALPADRQMAILPTRLRAEETLGQDLSAAVVYRDVDQTFGLHLRRSVLEVAGRPASADGTTGAPSFVLSVTRDAMGALLAGSSLDDALHNESVVISGDAAAAHRLFGWFERPFTQKPEVVLR